MSNRVLITGCAGFIGNETCRVMLEAGHDVAGIDNMNDYYDPGLKRARLNRLDGYSQFTFSEFDLVDDTRLRSLFEMFCPEYVIHLAAQAGVRYSKDNPAAYVHSNITATSALLEACRQHHVTHLVFGSSSSVYGLNVDVPFSTRGRSEHPASFYAATKRSGELMIHSYAHQYGLPATVLRFFTVYGPWGRPDMAPMLFSKAMLDGDSIPVFNYGEMERDFTYVDDVTECIQRIIMNPPSEYPEWAGEQGEPQTSSAPYRVFNVGNNAPVRLKDFISTLANALGVEPITDYVPMVRGDVLRTCADIDDLVTAFGYSPSTSLDVGIGRFVQWYRDYYAS